MAFTYLALGDSYTIGEQVPVYDSFPYQFVQMLRRNGCQFAAPEILAKTGWTSSELIEGVRTNCFLPHYNLVSLLVGVNNQYRGQGTASFEPEFEFLLQTAIRYAGNEPAKVFVLSIPDWGITPFARDRDPVQIALEIDSFNRSCKKISNHHHVNYIDITESQRHDGKDPDFLASDGLHPSGKEYSKWAGEMMRVFNQEHIKPA